MGLLRALTGNPLSRIANNIPRIQDHFVMGWIGRADASMRTFDLREASRSGVAIARGIVAAHAVFHCSLAIEERGYEKKSSFSDYFTRLTHLVSSNIDSSAAFADVMRYLVSRPSEKESLDRFVADVTRVLYPDESRSSMAAPLLHWAGEDVIWLCRLLTSEVYFDAAANLDFEHERRVWLDKIVDRSSSGGVL